MSEYVGAVVATLFALFGLYGAMWVYRRSGSSGEQDGLAIFVTLVAAGLVGFLIGNGGRWFYGVPAGLFTAALTVLAMSWEVVAFREVDRLQDSLVQGLMDRRRRGEAEPSEDHDDDETL